MKKQPIKIPRCSAFHITEDAFFYWSPSRIEMIVWQTGLDGNRVHSTIRIPMRVLAACVAKSRKAKAARKVRRG